jgi:hypothetical protein
MLAHCFGSLVLNKGVNNMFYGTRFKKIESDLRCLLSWSEQDRVKNKSNEYKLETLWQLHDSLVNNVYLLEERIRVLEKKLEVNPDPDLVQITNTLTTDTGWAIASFASESMPLVFRSKFDE